MDTILRTTRHGEIELFGLRFFCPKLVPLHGYQVPVLATARPPQVLLGPDGIHAVPLQPLTPGLQGISVAIRPVRSQPCNFQGKSTQGPCSTQMQVQEH